MNDAVRVCKGDGVADSEEHAKPRGSIRAGGEPAIEPVSTHSLHRVEPAAVWQLAEVVDRDDARVLEPGEDSCFLRQPRRHPVGVGRTIDDFERDLSVERRVAGQVDDAHAAATENRNQLVAGAGHVRAAEHGREAIERRL